MINEVIDISKDNFFDIDFDKLLEVSKALKLESYNRRLNKRNYNLTEKLLSMIDYIQRNLLKYYCDKLIELYNDKYVTIYSYEAMRNYWFYERFKLWNQVYYDTILNFAAFRFNCIISFVYLGEKGLVLINNNTYVNYQNDKRKKDSIDPNLLLELDFYDIRHEGAFILCEKLDKFHIYN